MNANEITAVVLAAPRGDASWGADGWETPICGLGALERVGRALAEFGAPEPWVVTDRSEIPGSWKGLLRLDAGLAARLEEVSFGWPVLVVRGDLPLLTSQSLRELVAAFAEGKGRRLVDLSGAVGIFRSAADAADALNSDAFSLGGGAWRPSDEDDVRRFGSPAEYGIVSRIARERILARLAAVGALFVDPAMTYVDEDVRIACGTTVFPGSFLRGRTTIGSGCTIGPDVWIESSDIEDHVTIRYSVVESARVREAASVGPYAHLRHESDVGPEARVGNFVEIKASRLGRCVKAGHLSYLGDADVGDSANVGAGTITCNYDGKAKHRTTIGNGAFVGSNTSLVAPVTIGDGAVIGAGSTITEDVPPNGLAIARARQVTKEKRHEPSGEDT